MPANVGGDFGHLHLHVKSRLEQDINAVVVPGKVPVALYKFQKYPLLFPCDCFPCHAIVDDGGKLNVKRIFAYQIIIIPDLKGQPVNTPDGMNRTVLCCPAHHLAEAILSARWWGIHE